MSEILNKLLIESMKEHHLDSVLKLEEQENTIPQSAAQFLKEIHSPTYINLVGILEGEIISFVVGQIIGDELHIYSLNVDNVYRRQGIASALIRDLIIQSRSVSADKATLEVRVNNDGAIALYESFGFVNEGIRPNYYQDNGEDAVIMWLNDFGGIK